MLVVHRANRASALADGLADLLATPLSDPFAAEVVAVPAKGVERWLAQRLSHRLGVSTGGATPTGTDGVCANVIFPSPRRVLTDAVAAAAPELAAQLSAWAPESLPWPLLHVLDANLHEDWCRVPRRHLFTAGDLARASYDRRLSFATHVARLFDSYARSRPEMLRGWADGVFNLANGSPIDEHEQWQPRLWRLLFERIGGASPVELHEQVCQAVRTHPDQLSLPQRISVFGASRLSRADLDLLAALGEQRDVHLWLHHASAALWDAVATYPAAIRRADDATPLTNPLLRSLSRDVRELQYLLRAHAPDHATTLHQSAAPGTGDRLLDRLRADLGDDHVPEKPQELDPTDRSVQVHACHGRTRQVEVLREVVVGLLADDPTLEPRDILVMCPDVETFAPLLAATFATGDAEPQSPTEATHPADRLRVRVADRALHQSNPLVAVLDRLLELGAARHTTSEVLDFAEYPAVARRFGFDDDAIERLRDWASTMGVRWGLHGEHRAAWQLQQVGDGTWRQGLDRLLLGAGVEAGQGGDARTIAGLVPVDDVDSADIDLAGRFAEFVDRLDAVRADLAGTRSPAAWADVLQHATLRLAAPERFAAWQEIQLRGILEETLVEHATEIGDDVSVSLAELRPMLRDALAGQPTRSGFRTGALTVCTLVPMRSVPHRVIILLGLDDGAFPRLTVRDGDDLLARDPWVGDRDPRSEDRQLLLDAVCAAEEHLIITYTGHDERSGAPVPPAVPLGELLDAVDRTVIGPDGSRGREAVTIHHPLQPFDPRAFAPSALGVDRAFSFDPNAYRGALAGVTERHRPPAMLSEPLAAPDPTDVELEDLIALIVHPARGFLRQRLQLSLTERDEEPADALPLALDALEQWQIGDRMLRERLAGLDSSTVQLLERGRGTLPPGRLGGRVLEQIGPRVDALAEAAAPLLVDEPDSRDVSVNLGDGTQLTGTVGGVRGDRLVRVEYSSLGPKHRLTSWVRLLALTVGHPDREWQAVTLGRGRRSEASRCACSTLGPIEPPIAQILLGQLVALYRDGLRSPLPVPCKTAAAYAARRGEGRRPNSARADAAREWNDGRFEGEQSDPVHVLVHGGTISHDELLAERARDTDYFNGWPSDEEGDRFGVLARRFWDPLLRYEKLDVR